MLRFSYRCLRPHLRTSFHHQPEAQHLKSSAIHNNAGRLPHLLTQSGHAAPGTLNATRPAIEAYAPPGFLRAEPVVTRYCERKPAFPPVSQCHLRFSEPNGVKTAEF